MKIELTDIETFYNNEIKNLERLKNNPPKWFNTYEACENSIMRGLGVAGFAQQTEPNLKFEDVDYLYEQFRTKVEEIEREANKK